VWFITGAWLRPAGLVTLLLGPLAALLAGPVAMLEAVSGRPSVVRESRFLVKLQGPRVE
jgi:hypothetical protein